MVCNAVKHGKCARGDFRLRGGRGVGVCGGRHRGSIRHKRELRGGWWQYREDGGGGTERAVVAGHRRGADGEGGWHVWQPGAAVTLRGRVSWFVPRSSIPLQGLAPTSDGRTHFRRFQIDLRPHWVVGLLLTLSHGLSYVSISLLYLILSILLDYISTSDLHP